MDLLKRSPPTNIICYYYILLRALCASRVMVKDPFHANCLPVHIGTLVELSKSNGKPFSYTVGILTDILAHVLL